MVYWIPILSSIPVMMLADWFAERFGRCSIVRGIRGDRGQWIVIIVVFLGMPTHWILSESAYARHIRPDRISTIGDHYLRFGEPRRIRGVKRNGATFYHLHGHLPASHLFALPSEPAVYVFDGSGKFVEWCRDPGDVDGLA